MTVSLPLDGVRVVDLTDGIGESAGRLLADLGAEVVRIEPPGGSASRSRPPLTDGVGIGYLLHNANKQVVQADPDAPEDRERLARLLDSADIVLESTEPQTLAALGVAPDDLRSRRPELVWLALTAFGRSGPYVSYQTDEAVLYAMSGVLSRSGAPGAEPLLPPRGLVEGTVGVHAVWAVLLAYFRRLRCGRGDRIDLSAFEAVVHGFDPGFGTQGSAAAGRRDDYPRDRPDAANFYPVFRSRDGRVRMCLLAPRQWQAMFAWLGEPAEFADPVYNSIPARFGAADRLHPLIGELFARHTTAELIAEGARRGIPIGGVADLREVLDTPHFTEAGALIDTELAPGVTARIPSGYGSIDGHRLGFRQPPREAGRPALPAPALPEPAALTTDGGDGDPAAAPLQGIRVLDLGVIVFGAELSRLLADYGADVIKVENARYPDGLRQTKRGARISPSVVWGHRNKRSLGIDLRSEAGAGLFRRLAGEADVVTANFKPGTLTSMGFGYDVLAEINPRIVVSESSAFGAHGPWRTRQGYGPLVRASAGVSALWRYPDDAELLCDGSTVYPDHVAGYVGAALVVAALIRRERTGTGAHIEMAQSDTALNQIGVELVAESIAPGSVTPLGNADRHRVPSGVFRCAGDDEWCALTVADDAQWRSMCELIGHPELAGERFATPEVRWEHRSVIHDLVSEWTGSRSPREAAEALQAIGIAAGPMLRLPELLTDPQLRHSETYTALSHDLLDGELPAAARSAHFTEIADPPQRPAPLAGEHTRRIATDRLGLTDAEIDALIDQGVLQEPEAALVS